MCFIFIEDPNAYFRIASKFFPKKNATLLQMRLSTLLQVLQQWQGSIWYVLIWQNSVAQISLSFALHGWLISLQNDKPKIFSDYFHHLGAMRDTVTSLIEGSLEFFDVDDSSVPILPTENAGWPGLGRVIVSLPSITTTVDMVGLSAASSWTQSNPMCMHLDTSRAM